MLYFTSVVLAPLAILLLISYVNIIWGPQLSQSGAVRKRVKVSLLVPARNEANNISRCLESLVRQEYTGLEILVLDDRSEDNTAELVAGYASRYPNLTLIRGEELPPGWTGKNWACHQLSQRADGDLLIFTDADNWHTPDAVTRTVAWMQLTGLGVFSAFPQQITRTLPEKLLVPMIDVILYSSLPLPAVTKYSAPSLSAANGQWLAFTREAYQSLGGHQAVRSEVVEDVQLARKSKEYGIRTMTAAGTGVVFARMYRTLQETWEGMAKIMFGLTGYRSAVFWIAVPMVFLMAVAPYVLIWFRSLALLAGIAIAVNVLIRGGLALRYRHPVVLSVLLHPLAVLVTLMICLDSYRRIRKGVIRWKGRDIVLTSA